MSAKWYILEKISKNNGQKTTTYQTNVCTVKDVKKTQKNDEKIKKTEIRKNKKTEK